MTMAEKIFKTHCKALTSEIKPGQILMCTPDIVLINDASGPLTFKQFYEMGASKVANPKAVVMVNDHFAPPPTLSAAHGMREMRTFASKYRIENFFEIGEGIEHTLLPERGFIKPGQLIIGGDSHTCTYGAFGAFGTGLGSTDIAAALALGELWFRVPESSQFVFTGKPKKFVTGKDLILTVIGEIGVDGATYQSMEFTGEGLRYLNMDERMAICNMAVEAGAKAGMVVPDEVTEEWAKKTLHDYTIVKPDNDAKYVTTHKYDLSKIDPMIAKPDSPGNVSPLSEVEGTHVDQVYIGNCANGTLTDLRQAASVLAGKTVAKGTRLIVVPATRRVYLQALKEGLIEIFASAGAAVSSSTCGACFGGHMGLLDKGEVAITTTNRNFKGRMGHADASIYLANAYVAAAAAVAGEIVNPAKIADVTRISS